MTTKKSSFPGMVSASTYYSMDSGKQHTSPNIAMVSIVLALYYSLYSKTHSRQKKHSERQACRSKATFPAQMLDPIPAALAAGTHKEQLGCSVMVH